MSNKKNKNIDTKKIPKGQKKIMLSIGVLISFLVTLGVLLSVLDYYNII